MLRKRATVVEEEDASAMVSTRCVGHAHFMSGHECTWSQEEDARRPATKQLVESLRVRIRELESELSQLRAASATAETARTSMVPSSASSEAEAAKADPQLEFSGQSHLTMQEGNITASGPTSMWSTFPSDDLSPPQYPSIDDHSYQFIFLRDPNIPAHIQPRATQLSDQCEWDRNLCLTQLDPSIGFDRLEHDVLLDRCFNFHTVWLRVIEPEHFLRDMLAQLTSGYPDPNPHQARALGYSPFLHCALMSVATAFSDNPKVKSKQARLHFAQCAKQYLENECERPTITAVQALTYLSDFHGSLGERGLAYLYFGMSCRMVRALGLCIDSRPWVESKRITPEELVARDWQFWSTFCQDKIMSLDYGRDYDIPLPHLNVNLPEIVEHFDQRLWPGDRLQSPTEPEKPQPNRATRVFFETCKLMLFAVRIMDAVYSQGRQNWRVTQKDSVSEIHLQLDMWYNNLPENFTISARSAIRPLPHIIVLNIAYWWLLLLLHRPFYARTSRSASNTSAETPASFTDLSVKICDRATVKIVQLVMLFDKYHGMRYFPLSMLQAVFITGATLLVQSATLSESAVKKRAEAHDGTRKCIYALQAAAQTWDAAQLSADHLQGLLQEQTGETSVQPPTQAQQGSSNESSPLTYQHPALPNTSGPGTYAPVAALVPTPTQLYREFVSQQDTYQHPLGYSISIPSQVQHQLQYPALHQLHQQPLMGMPSGAQFTQNPHVLPLPYDPNFNEGYAMNHGNGTEYYPDGNLAQPQLPQEGAPPDGLFPN
ncbi:unnamed protein product [Rhizoctonia solani]|uniref:Xylanolytic transcriptional activator regulatory domain-containing protein n=1 Tax=Rhizoctonia solani TaxID=456999 RepID=A0A8H2X3K1_9AGAM|nr:unnamed protein product [Rhizoctonia solani]